MSRYLLDTDILTLAQFGHALVIRHLDLHPTSDIALSAISLQEQMRGWLSRINNLTDVSQLADWYDRLVSRIFPVWKRFELLPFTVSAIARFHALRSLRLNIGLNDLRLAAVALESGLVVVVSRNKRDFGRVPGLQIEDWTT